MSTRVLIASEWLFWAVLALILWLQTGAFSEEIAEYKFGADGWPKMVILGIIVGATGQAAFKWFAVSVVNEGDEARQDASEAPVAGLSPPVPLPTNLLSTGLLPKNSTAWRKLGQKLAIFGLPLVYLWAMHRIGFFVASPLFIALYLYVLEARNWRHIAGVTAIILALVFYVFVRLFYVAVPVGAWEIFYSVNNEIITYIRLGL